MLIKLALRGFVQVCPTGAATVFIASHNWLGAAACSFLISYIWFGNVHATVRLPGKLPAVAYALGAMCGTVAGGMLAAGL